VLGLPGARHKSCPVRFTRKRTTKDVFEVNAIPTEETFIPRKPRYEFADSAQVQVFHAIQRCVRRAFLCGDEEKGSGLLKARLGGGSTLWMSRPKRADEKNAIYHAVNRGNGRSFIFHKATTKRLRIFLPKGLSAIHAAFFRIS